MRIDLTHAAAGQIADESIHKQVSAKEVSACDPDGDRDRTTLASAQQALSGLVSNAMASPEIRQELVNNLKQAIQSGNYELHPGKIAQSIIDEHA
jgi:flagellar biosynthesis anti-sigma factor FlgM